MRLSPIERDDLNDQQRTVLEAIESGPRGNSQPGIGMMGPFGAWGTRTHGRPGDSDVRGSHPVQHVTAAERSGSRHLYCRGSPSISL